MKGYHPSCRYLLLRTQSVIADESRVEFPLVKLCRIVSWPAGAPDAEERFRPEAAACACSSRSWSKYSLTEVFKLLRSEDIFFFGKNKTLKESLNHGAIYPFEIPGQETISDPSPA